MRGNFRINPKNRDAEDIIENEGKELGDWVPCRIFEVIWKGLIVETRVGEIVVHEVLVKYRLLWVG